MQWSRRAHELRDLLNRNGIQFGFYDLNSETGQALLAETHTQGEPLPVVIRYDGLALPDPTNAQVAEALGARTIYEPEAGPGQREADVVVVGAGPAGLSAAVNGASEGLRVVVVEREALGGQAGMSARIRNYLGFPTGISGDELAWRAFTQARLFRAEFIFTQEVMGLQASDDGYIVTLSDGSEIPGKTVILAMGVSYRRLEIPALERLIGAGVFYGSVGAEAMALRGKNVFVVGGANAAGQAALHLSNYAERVTMLVRGPSLVENMSDYLIQGIEARDNIEVRSNTMVIDGAGENHLEQLVLRDDVSGRVETVSAEGLFVLIGAKPRTDWLPPEIIRDRSGYILTGPHLVEAGQLPESWPLPRPPFMLETSLPGVFAAGDVRHRSIKRVASAVGEGSMAIQFIHQFYHHREFQPE